MRLLIWFGLILVLFGAAARADAPRPAELPPRDYASAQYIDSAGCVFRHQEGAWVAALTDDQVQVCGFPPSRSVWAGSAPGPAGRDPLTVQRDLTLLVVTANGGQVTKKGDVDQIRSPEPTAEVLPATTPADDGTAAEILRGLAVRRELARRVVPYDPANGRLCALLGLQGPGGKPAVTGDDPTGGLCSGQAAKLPGYKPRDTTIAAAAGTMKAASPHSGATDGAPTRRSAGRAKAIGADDPGAEAGHVVAAKRPGADRPSAQPVEMVGAHARFVQIGRFDPSGVEAVTKALMRLGYPVVRETVADADGKRRIMAGPFPTRSALISALDGIRRAGYHRAVAR